MKNWLDKESAAVAAATRYLTFRNLHWSQLTRFFSLFSFIYVRDGNWQWPNLQFFRVFDMIWNLLFHGSKSFNSISSWWRVDFSFHMDDFFSKIGLECSTKQYHNLRCNAYGLHICTYALKCSHIAHVSLRVSVCACVSKVSRIMHRMHIT